MTDRTKRLAKYATHKPSCPRAPLSRPMDAPCECGFSETIREYSRTAAQEANVANMCGSAGGQFIVAAPHPAAPEANVQGGFKCPMCGIDSPHIHPSAIIYQGRRMANADAPLNEWDEIGRMQFDDFYKPYGSPYEWRVLHVIASSTAAPHPTPAPASGAVTDAMVMAALGELDWDAVGDECKRNLMRNALKAAARARQGEGGECSCPQHGNWIHADDVKRLVRELDVAINGEAGAAKQASLCDIVSQVKHRGLAAPNAADAEAYRAVTLEDAERIVNEYFLDGSVHSMPHALQSIGAVIPTAAPVPAEQDRVGRLQIYVEKELCSLLGRPWATSGFSIETLIADLRKRLAVPADEGEKK